MKILQVGPKSVHVSSFIFALKERQKNIYLLSEEACDFEGVIEEFVISFRQLQPWKVIKNYLKVKKLVQGLKPDVIHIHQVNRLAFVVAKIAKSLNIRVVSTAWGSDVLLMPKKNILYKFIVRSTLKNSDAVTADSKDMILAMKSIVNEDKYLLLQYGIDPIESAEKEKIIYSNRLHESLYRIDQIITYFAEFSKTNPDWKLVIAGTGSETRKLKNRSQELEIESKIAFVGWQQKEENRRWYAKSMIYISIPASDGTSVSLLEAMSASCIPIVSDLPVSQEWIRQNENGVIEMRGHNPIDQAIKINREQCISINSQLINDRATRKSSIDQFLKAYGG
ncbi:MAG: glycosyltransferase [Crocinitomicaceae bacterium]|jgi:glycosyltransferase involved in cell wall biosynthesis